MFFFVCFRNFEIMKVFFVRKTFSSIFQEIKKSIFNNDIKSEIKKGFEEGNRKDFCYHKTKAKELKVFY